MLRVSRAFREFTGKVVEICKENQDLKTENAKLQEMVEDMLSCIEICAAFGRPPTEEMYETFAQRARELGIEVEDA